MDIVAQLRQGVDASAGRPYRDALDDELMQGAADTIEFLRTEIDRLGNSLNKCHAKLMRANCPVWDARNSEE